MNPVPQDPRPDDRLAQAAALAQQLVGEIEQLSGATGQQIVSLSRTAKTNRRLIWVSIASVAFDLALTVVIAMGGLQISSLTHRLDVAQTTQRQKALCPLYQVFLDSKSPEGRAAAPDPLKYDHAFKVIQEGYDALECSDFISQASR